MAKDKGQGAPENKINLRDTNMMQGVTSFGCHLNKSTIKKQNDYKANMDICTLAEYVMSLRNYCPFLMWNNGILVMLNS